MGIKNQIHNRILSKNFYLAKLAYPFLYYLKSLSKQPLLIYQMGKVASTSVEASLRATPLNMEILHFHYLSSNAIALDEKYYFEERVGFNKRLKRPFPSHLFISYFIRNPIYSRLLHRNKKWKIITLVRDPIARNISGFFQAITLRIPDFYERMESITFDELCTAFLEKYEHEVPLTWFDFEMYPFFGVDVYAKEFPTNRGYEIYSSKKADVLLIRVEDLSRCFGEAISEFLGKEDVRLVFMNEAKDKTYYPLYKDFVEKLVLPDDYIDKMYNSKFVRHFYTDDEIKQFSSHWTGNTKGLETG